MFRKFSAVECDTRYRSRRKFVSKTKVASSHSLEKSASDGGSLQKNKFLM
jgi:hypothetical protein